MDWLIMFIGKIIIIFLLVASCSATNKFDVNPWTTIVKYIVKEENKNE
tara:strand:- start:76 stop:219 length:144 start_codon:yes stop_codon:yes gene_type:complete